MSVPGNHGERHVSFAGRKIGGGAPCFVIAEAGVNHNGSVQAALELIDAAAEARADAVKFQTFDPDALVSIHARKARYQAERTGAGESQHAMLKSLALGDDAFARLKEHAARRNILFFSTPFDEVSAQKLDVLGVPLFKIPSGEITNLPFLAYVARFRKPLIISTGMSTLGEVETAVHCVQGAGNDAIVLLHCVSSYPAPAKDVNLRAMNTLRTAFGFPAGYSDHTLGAEVALAAVALGAEVIEKHFTLDKKLPGPDHQASLEPHELARLVEGIRVVEAALGSALKRRTESEADTVAVVRKSIVAACDIPAGSILTAQMLALKRPGTGLAPVELPHVIGRRLKVDVSKDELLTREMLL